MSVYLQIKTLLAELDLDDEGVSLGDFIDKLVERDRTNALIIKNICTKFEEADRTFDSDDIPESVGQLFRSYQSVRDREASLTKKLKPMEDDLASLRTTVAAATGSHAVSLAIIRINSLQGAIDALYKALGVVAGDPQKVAEMVVQDKLDMAEKLSVLERRNVQLQKSLDAVVAEEQDAAEALFQLAVRCGAPPSIKGGASVAAMRGIVEDALNRKAELEQKPVLYVGANPMGWNVLELIYNGASINHSGPARQLMQQLESKVYGPALTFDGAAHDVRVAHMQKHLNLNNQQELVGYIMNNYVVQ